MSSLFCTFLVCFLMQGIFVTLAFVAKASLKIDIKISSNMYVFVYILNTPFKNMNF